MKRFPLCTLGILLVVATLVWWRFPRHPVTLSTEVYVWQQSDSPELRKALERSHDIATRRHFLAVEISRHDGGIRAKRSAIPADLLPGNGLVMRIGSSLAAESWHDGEALDRVLAEASWMAAMPAAELQIDYDSPQRSLGDYLSLLNKIKAHHPERKWSITALPSWLDEATARPLFQRADGVILQLHSLNLPERPERPVVLCDPQAARRSVKKISSIGIPFRVALNTYACEVFFDDLNRVLDVVSEDIQNPPPGATRRSMGISHATQLAQLVSEWKQNPPNNLHGIIWYRLPLETDRRNWRHITWRRVASGVAPASELRLETRSSDNGAWDIVVTNHGERDERLPEKISTGCRTLVLEGSNGYAFEATDRLKMETSAWPWIAPGDSLIIGWLRPRQATERPSPTAAITQ